MQSSDNAVSSTLTRPALGGVGTAATEGLYVCYGDKKHVQGPEDIERIFNETGCLIFKTSFNGTVVSTDDGSDPEPGGTKIVNAALSPEGIAALVVAAVFLVALVVFFAYGRYTAQERQKVLVMERLISRQGHHKDREELMHKTKLLDQENSRIKRELRANA